LTESISTAFIPAQAYSVDTINYNIFYRYMPRGMVLWSAKVPKALCQSSNEPLRNLTRIKKTGTLRFVFNIFFKIKSSVMNTKPLRFRFVIAIFTVVHLFF